MSSYENPVVRGNAPDPSAVRVGDDYYLATSSFGMMPGIAIRHSTDLVHWRIIGFAVTRPAQYRRDGRPGDIVLFAPTLRYHDGTFYLACTNMADRQGNFIVTASDPSGPSSDAIWLDREGFDPSLFRDDDGIWYYTRRTLRLDAPDGNLGPIVQAAVDIETGELGPFQELTENNRGFASNDIEGPHLYRRNDWYYLSSAEGSSWKGHMQTIARSRSPWGPFEAAGRNPILTHRDRVAHPIQSLGHAELLEDAQGQWWALSLGTRHPGIAQHHNLGRETFLTPVQWGDDDWPVVGEHGHTELRIDDVMLPRAAGTEHQVAETLWSQGWQSAGAPHPDLDPAVDPAAPASIRLPWGAALPGEDTRPAGALLRPQTEDGQVFSAALGRLHGAGRAGVGVFADPRHQYSVTVQTRATDRLVVFTRIVDDMVITRETVLPAAGELTLTIRASVESYAFSATIDAGRELETIQIGAGSARLLSAEVAQWFVGVQFALLAYADTAAEGCAHFQDVSIETVPVSSSVAVPV